MPRRVLEGDVVSDKMDKTVTVLVERRFMHPVYKKYVRLTDKYAAHDENNAFSTGDRVQIEECRPISKRKSWRVITVPAEGQKRAPKPVAAAEEKAPKAKAVKKAKAEAKAEAKTEAKTDVKGDKDKAASAKKPAAKKAPAKKAAAKKTAAKKTAKK